MEIQMEKQNGIIHLPTKALSGERKYLDSTQIRIYLLKLLNELEIASGKKQDDSRISGLSSMLEESNVNERHLKIARYWILRGDPCKYGELTFADFFPSQEKIEQLKTNNKYLIRDENNLAECGYKEYK